MATTLTFLIIVAAIAVAIVMRKFSHTSKTYLVNFSIALLMGLLFLSTLMRDEMDWISYVAIATCGLACIAQVFLGIKNLRSAE